MREVDEKKGTDGRAQTKMAAGRGSQSRWEDGRGAKYQNPGWVVTWSEGMVKQCRLMLLYSV